MEHATNPTTPATPASKAPFLTTEQFMTGLHPFSTITGEYLLEPCEAFEKLKTVVSLLMHSQDEKTQELRISGDRLSWALLLIHDLIDEAEERSDKYETHCGTLWREFEKRLDACHLIVNDHEAWGSLASGNEV